MFCATNSWHLWKQYGKRSCSLHDRFRIQFVYDDNRYISTSHQFLKFTHQSTHSADWFVNVTTSPLIPIHRRKTNRLQLISYRILALCCGPFSRIPISTVPPHFKYSKPSNREKRTLRLLSAPQLPLDRRCVSTPHECDTPCAVVNLIPKHISELCKPIPAVDPVVVFLTGTSVAEGRQAANILYPAPSHPTTVSIAGKRLSTMEKCTQSPSCSSISIRRTVVPFVQQIRSKYVLHNNWRKTPSAIAKLLTLRSNKNNTFAYKKDT